MNRLTPAELRVLEAMRRLIEVAEELAEQGEHGERCPRVEWWGVEPDCNCGWADLQTDADTAIRDARAALGLAP